jgi:hypothetical protein
MASSLTITNSTYAGELALPYINAALLSGDTLAKGYVTLKEGVKFKAVLKRLASNSLVQSAACNFSESGALDLTESVLEVSDLMTNLEVCKKQFADDWEAAATGRGFINDVVPSNFTDFLIGYAAAKVGETIEYTIWQGNTASGSYQAFNGLEKKIKDENGTYYDNTWTSGAMAVGTVIDNLNQVINNLPPALIGSPETKLYMNRATAQFYRQAVAAEGYLQMFTASDSFNLQFNGYDIYVCPGMSAGTVIAAQPTNLFVGVDANSDFAEVKVVDMSLTDASDNVRMAMRYRVGVQVGIYQDVVIGRNS